MLRRRSPKNTVSVAEINIERFRRAQRGIFKIKKNIFFLIKIYILFSFWRWCAEQYQTDSFQECFLESCAISFEEFLLVSSYVIFCD